MARRARLVLAAGALVWLAVPAAPVSAGGGSGCHTGMTHGTGDTVLIREGCFTPGILRVEPGASVAFSNEDPYQHNVSASGWGHLDPLDQSEGFSATFDAPGIYPFACTYHPAMTGAIVVGKGLGAGNGELVSVSSLLAEPAEASLEEPVAAPEPVAATPSRGTSAMGWVTGGAIGLAAGLGGGLAVGRRRRSQA